MTSSSHGANTYALSLPLAISFLIYYALLSFIAMSTLTTMSMKGKRCLWVTWTSYQDKKATAKISPGSKAPIPVTS